MPRGSTLVEILMRTGLVGEPEIEKARRRQERRGGSLLESLVLGGASEVDLARGLSGALRLPVVNLRGKRIDPEVIALVPRAVAEKHACLPLFTKDEQGTTTLYLGVEDPTDRGLLEDVGRRAGLTVRPVVVGPIQLRATLRASYPEPDPEPDAVEVASVAPTTEDSTGSASATDDDTAPVLVAAPAAERESASPAARPAREKPRDVPTRIILRALLQVLIEKEIITRGELLAAVDDLRGRRERPSDH